MRREYGITRDDLYDLDAQDFIECLAGLSAESRFYADRQEAAAPATVQGMVASLTPEQYLDGLQRHRGRVVRVRAAS